jgi:CubicO group peptidase (beta-lactamase class C family)
MKKGNLFTRCLSGCLLLLLLTISCAAQVRYPGEHWELVGRAEDYGYSSAKLKEAEEYAGTIDTAAVMIIVDGALIYQWGDVSKKYITHSTRKSFLSALYGKYVHNGTIDLNKTMRDLGIDDEPELTGQEKMATIRDCLKARSGVYHTAEAESAGMHNLKPDRGTFRAGEFWLYNNWDFNVLGTIFQQLTGKNIFQALKEDIGDPIGMEDFTPEDGRSFRTNRSLHEAYMFIISARDMARFGLLFLRNGRWNGTQVIPEDWIKESTAYFSDATIYRSDGYGYMWWAVKHHNKYPHFPNVDLEEGTYSARGAGGHYLVIIPDRDLVVVHRVDTFQRGQNVAPGEFGTLLKKILDARLD